MSGYTSSELNREISDLRIETVNINDLSSTVFTSIIGDIANLNTSVSDNIYDLSSTVFTSIIGDINTLSSVSDDIHDLSSTVFTSIIGDINTLSFQRI